MNLILIWPFSDMDGVRVGAEEREEYRVVVSKTFKSEDSVRKEEVKAKGNKDVKERM
jgi:hypothetical protein